MYRDIIESFAYSISFDFGDAFSLSQNNTSLILPLFLTVLGIRIGISLLRYIIQQYVIAIHIYFYFMKEGFKNECKKQNLMFRR